MLVVIPAHNEADNLPFVVGELRRESPDVEILVVDDASTDSTPEVLSQLDVHRMRLRQQLGVGGALRAGLRWAEREGFQTVVRCDGDGQHRAEDLRHLLSLLRDGGDAVIGSRYLGQDGKRTPGYAASGYRRSGQRLLAWLVSWRTRGALTDPTSGFWAFGPRAVHLLARHHPTGYPEPELLLFLHRNGLTVREAPVTMRPRRGGRSTLTWERELMATARVLLALLIVPLRRREVVLGEVSA